MNLSLRRLLSFIADLYDALPDDFCVQLPKKLDPHIKLFRLKAEADEMWSFVGRRQNKQWVRIVIDVETRQVIAFYIGERSRNSAGKLWDRIPEIYQRQANFDTDD